MKAPGGVGFPGLGRSMVQVLFFLRIWGASLSKALCASRDTGLPHKKKAVAGAGYSGNPKAPSFHRP